MLDRRDDKVRLRFVGNEEIFYLTSEPASLGGRVLKYDTGDVALTVAGWGGVTLYTDKAPSGIPAERQDATTDIDPKPVAARDVKSFATKLSHDLLSNSVFNIVFDADWDRLSRDDTARALAVDAMRNAGYALEQFSAEAEHNPVAGSLHMVRVMQGAQPGIVIEPGTLVIRYAPKGGPSARPSSLAIARALEAAF